MPIFSLPQKISLWLYSGMNNERKVRISHVQNEAAEMKEKKKSQVNLSWRIGERERIYIWHTSDRFFKVSSTKYIWKGLFYIPNYVIFGKYKKNISIVKNE